MTRSKREMDVCLELRYAGTFSACRSRSSSQAAIGACGALTGDGSDHTPLKNNLDRIDPNRGNNTSSSNARLSGASSTLIDSFTHGITQCLIPAIMLFWIMSGVAGAGDTNPLQLTQLPPSDQAMLTTSQQTANIGDAYCFQQLNDLSIGLQSAALASSFTGHILKVTAEGVGVATETTNVIVANPSPTAAWGLMAAGEAFEIAAAATSASVIAVTDKQFKLPSCEWPVIGTLYSQVDPVTGLYGGVNIAGNSYFHDNVSFASNLYAAGNIYGSQIFTTQGISTNGGHIFIGDPNGTTWSSGITIGGGALSGAGFGGQQAISLDPTAIAIGNNAQALQVGSLAHGLNATAAGANSTAIGTGATAIANGSTALGNAAAALGDNSSAIGKNSFASGMNAAAFGFLASAQGTASTALGNNAVALNNFSLAAGFQALAGGDSAVAVGQNAWAANSRALAIGTNTIATGTSASAFGTNANALADSSVAVGHGAQSQAVSTVAIGNGAYVGAGAGLGSFAGGTSSVLGGTGAVSIGHLNQAVGNGAVAIGDPNIAIGAGAVALGADNFASGKGSVAIGNWNVALGKGSVAQGNSSMALAIGSIAVGDSSLVTGTGSQGVAIGSGSATSGSQAMALGVSALASGNSGVAVGQLAMATATGASAFGQMSMASSNSAIAAGTKAVASGEFSAAVGNGAKATGISSIAVGDGAVANANSSTAFGSRANVATAHTNSSAIGAGATTTVDNQMVFGTTSQSYQAPGIDSSLSRSRQTGPLRLVTSDASGNLATDSGLTFTEIAKSKAGAAMAMAMQAPTLAQNEHVGLRFGWGNFDSNANAFAISAIGVVCHECFLGGDRLAIDAAAAVGNSSFYSYGSGTVKGFRAGAQLTW